MIPKQTITCVPTAVSGDRGEKAKCSKLLAVNEVIMTWRILKMRPAKRKLVFIMSV